MTAMDVERDPADVTSNNGKPLVPISDQQPSRTLSQRKAEPTKPRRSPAQSNPAQSAPTYCGDTMKYYDARETRDPAAREPCRLTGTTSVGFSCPYWLPSP